MMQDYHIGSLDEASRAVLQDADEAPADASSGPRPVFLNSKVWTKAVLATKRVISADTRIFTFNLEHPAQEVGLPIGQHLMVRLRDPVTREAIIRSYTPISENKTLGTLELLVKVYFDTPQAQGGKMTKAMDSLPLGHFVDFKGPIGKFEYLGNGKCTVMGKDRHVKRFIMICAGSGITPIFQVLRAVLTDEEDPTKCLVLDGNRLEEDILCREELDELARGRERKCKLLYSLTQPKDGWTGLKGRMGKELLEREVVKGEEGEELVLICGPGPLEKAVHAALKDMGWKDQDFLFF